MQPERTIRRARRLRKSPTRAEEFVWSLVRDKALDGLRFRRQVPIGSYVVDFACLSARLIIEADGGIHALWTFDDAKRDAWLASQGFRVLRISNADILARPSHVLAAIRAAASKPHPSGSACHLPPKWGKESLWLTPAPQTPRFDLRLSGPAAGGAQALAH